MLSHVSSLDDLYGGGTHLVKFSSPTCGPCRTAATVVDRISKDSRFSGVSFWDVNIMDPTNSDIVRKLSIRSVPVVVVVKDGENRSIMVGGEIAETALEDTLLNLIE